MGAITNLVSTINSLSWDQYQGGVQQQMGALNQQFYGQAANSALQAGNEAAARTQMKATQAIGAETAGFASSGVDASSGSAVEAAATTRQMATLDSQTQQNNAAREAWGYNIKGVQALQQGYLDSQKSHNDAIGSALGGFGTEVSDIVMPAMKGGS